MLHIYRQVTSLRSWQPVVICQKRENESLFPFNPKRTTVLEKPPWRWLRRTWHRHVVRGPVPVTTGRVIRLLEEVYRHDARVVHVFFGNIAVQLLPFIQACPKPVVVSFHGADAGVDVEHPKFKQALLGVFAAARLVLGRSQSLLTELGNLGCPAEKLRLQRTGLLLEEWPFVERPWPENGEWRWLQAGRMVAKKGLRTTLAVFRNLAPRFPGAVLTLAGDGPLRGEIESLVAAWGLAGRVHFTGFVNQSQLRDLAYASHLFLHPSETPADGNREGVPNAMIEAMASGLPVLATQHGGIPEAIEDGVSGLLAPEGDVDTLTAAVLRVMTSVEEYRRLAAGGRHSVEENFERSRATRALEAIYDEAGGPAAAG